MVRWQGSRCRALYSNRACVAISGKKKAPGAAGGRNLEKIFSAATGSARAAGTCAGTGAAQWHRRGNRETGARTGINEIDLDLTAVVDQAFIHEKLQSIEIEDFVVFFWLIQSQAQGGPGSATLHDGNTNGGVNIVLRQIFFEIFLCQFGYFQHELHLLSFGWGKKNS
jgi:hypothetical protein